MADYLSTGTPVYSFAEGAQDQYMQMVIAEAIESGKPVRMRTQPWAE